jgi:hypothetical protein
MGGDSMMGIVERAMEAGNSVLIENMGEAIDAALNPVITRCGWPVGGGEQTSSDGAPPERFVFAAVEKPS